MNYIASTLLADSANGIAQQCSDLWETCNNGCGANAIFPDCVSFGGSCTPYSFMPNVQNQNCDWMDVGTSKNGWAQFSTSPFFDYSSAYSYQAFQAPGVDDVWIVHGCDGGGIQTDCAGDILYLEHFMSKSPVWEEACPVSTYGQTHYQCPTFYHQGKQESYSDYSCGWWRGYSSPVGIEDASIDGIGAFGAKDAGDGSNADYSNSIRSILDNCPTCAGGSALWHPYEGTNAKAYFTGAAWPWICDDDGDSKMYPYTGSTMNCYCDNEPFNGRQWVHHGTGIAPTYPQGTQIIYCGLYDDVKLVCDFVYLDSATGEAVASNRRVEMYTTDF